MVAKPGRPSGIGKALAAAPPPTTACYGALRTDFARRLIGQGELTSVPKVGDVHQLTKGRTKGLSPTSVKEATTCRS